MGMMKIDHVREEDHPKERKDPVEEEVVQKKSNRLYLLVFVSESIIIKIVVNL